MLPPPFLYPAFCLPRSLKVCLPLLLWSFRLPPTSDWKGNLALHFGPHPFYSGRAAAVAAPAGLVIWILANVSIGDISLLARFSGYLDPIGRLMGMDGVILMAFILGLPANEIVIPIIIMAYTSQGT